MLLGPVQPLSPLLQASLAASDCQRACSPTLPCELRVPFDPTVQRIPAFCLQHLADAPFPLPACAPAACSDTMGMNLDPQFVRDLTVLIAASAAAGLAMSAVGQPAINGYFVAGSLVGPGGLKLIKEIVQVGSLGG